MSRRTAVALASIVVMAVVGCAADGRRTQRSTSLTAPDILQDDAGAQSLRRAVVSALAGVERRAGQGARGECRELLRSLRDAIPQTGPIDLARLLRGRARIEPSQPALVTGYYEPVLPARRRRDARFRFPIHALPSNARLVAASRAEVDAGALAGRGLELFWLDDPVELYFLQVQGSGRLRLEDGREVRVSHAGSNGLDYVSIGKLLVEDGSLERGRATSPAIKQWLRENPDRAVEVMRRNPRYVFFRQVQIHDDDGPIGSLGVPLVAWRSVAVDPAVTPLGCVGYLDVPFPDGQRWRGLVVAMDTGAAIKGAGRLDFFLGTGAEAGVLAGGLAGRGTIRWLSSPER